MCVCMYNTSYHPYEWLQITKDCTLWRISQRETCSWWTTAAKDVVKRHLKATHITVDHWETLAQDRQQWRQAIHTAKSHIEEKISQKYQHDYNLRHGFPDASAPVIFCVNCGRGFKSQIGLFSHQRAKHVTDEPLHWCHHRTRWTAKREIIFILLCI